MGRIGRILEGCRSDFILDSPWLILEAQQGCLSIRTPGFPEPRNSRCTGSGFSLIPNSCEITSKSGTGSPSPLLSLRVVSSNGVMLLDC